MDLREIVAAPDPGPFDAIRLVDPRQTEAQLLSTSCRDLKIVAMLNDRAGCGHFRCISPLTILQRHGALVYFIEPLTPEQVARREERIIPLEVMDGANVVILQRTTDPRVIELVGDKERRKRLGRLMIYENDDDIARIDPKNPAAHRKGGVGAGTHTPQLVRNAEKIAREADALFVSTPELAASWCRFNKRTFVLPNSIDFSIRPAWTGPIDQQVGQEGDVVIGWTGGLHHFGDEEPLVGVLPDILRRFPQAHLAVCSNPLTMIHFLGAWGMGHVVNMPPRHAPNSPIKQRGVMELQGYPEFKGRWSRINPVDFQIYPLVLRQLQIGLAPLEMNAFNRSKSALRLLEYGAVGVPYVASPSPAYVQFHRETNGCGGFIARTKREWSEAIALLVGDERLRKEMSAAIQERVRRDYNTDEVGLHWATAIRQVQAGAISTWTPREAPGNNQACPCGSGMKYKRCCYPTFG